MRVADANPADLRSSVAAVCEKKKKPTTKKRDSDEEDERTAASERADLGRGRARNDPNDHQNKARRRSGTETPQDQWEIGQEVRDARILPPPGRFDASRRTDRKGNGRRGGVKELIIFMKKKRAGLDRRSLSLSPRQHGRTGERDGREANG